MANFSDMIREFVSVVTLRRSTSFVERMVFPAEFLSNTSCIKELVKILRVSSGCLDALWQILVI